MSMTAILVPPIPQMSNWETNSEKGHLLQIPRLHELSQNDMIMIDSIVVDSSYTGNFHGLHARAELLQNMFTKV